MIPFGDKTITLLHKAAEGYERHSISGCSWRSTDVRTLSGTSIVCTVETTCRIPPGNIIPIPGDLIAIGNIDVSARNEIELVRAMQKLRESGISVFRVERVKDNAQGAPIPHYAATGA